MGMLLRIILILVAIWLLVRFVRKIVAGIGTTKDSPKISNQPMVACAHCGIFVPKEQALTNDQNRYFCCKEHLQSS